MKFLRYAVLFSVVLFPISTWASSGGGTMMRRGGVGFIFSDANDFQNPGQASITHGSALQAEYTRQNQTQDQVITPSFVWGNGKFGLGAYASRSGTDLGSAATSTDTVGGEMGLSLLQDRLNMGVGFGRSISTNQTSDGVLDASINLSGHKGVGFNLGVGGSTTINNAGTEVHTGTAALGWGFAHGGIEADYVITDLSNSSQNYKAMAAVNIEGHSVYLGAGYGYEKPLNASFAMARLGLMLGHIDISGHMEYTFLTGSNPTYGGTFRISF